MSNKLVKEKKPNEKSLKRKKKIYNGSLIVLIVAFVFVWVNIFLTSREFEKRLDNMVEGVDYFFEDIKITDKRVETGDIYEDKSEHYFLYYHHGKTYDYHKRIQVPGEVYSAYDVGDVITAYTTDHVQYYYEKVQLLPEYSGNEMSKIIGVLLGIGIVSLLLFILLDEGTAKARR